MTPARFDDLISRFARLRVGVVGDFSLDRYFDIDPARVETSLETGLPVHNVTRVRCSPGAAGNIVQNLGALGAGTLWPVGFCGEDGEGFELLKALRAVPGVSLDNFLRTPDRRTFTYTKPLLQAPPKAPVELSRLDIKNWLPTPGDVEHELGVALRNLGPQLDALIVMDQAGVPGAGVITPAILHTVRDLTLAHPQLVVLADSRHGLGQFPPLIFKMNAAEFLALTHPGKAECHPLSDIAPDPTASPGAGGRESVCHPMGDKRADPRELPLAEIMAGAERIAGTSKRAVFITLAERGIVGAAPGGPAVHAPALPVRGEIDIVGAGDAVTAALTLALAAGAPPGEAMALAQAAASVVIHQLGTTGAARGPELRALLFP
jgi:bifunctional ADP-heptose synthase (sugar kinase/adenylyltransferase)